MKKIKTKAANDIERAAPQDSRDKAARIDQVRITKNYDFGKVEICVQRIGYKSEILISKS